MLVQSEWCCLCVLSDLSHCWVWGFLWYLTCYILLLSTASKFSLQVNVIFCAEPVGFSQVPSLYIRECPCTAVTFLAGAQAQHGWRSIEMEHFPLCRRVPLSGVFFFPRGYLTTKDWHSCNQNSAYRKWLRIPRRQSEELPLQRSLGAGNVN